MSHLASIEALNQKAVVLERAAAKSREYQASYEAQVVAWAANADKQEAEAAGIRASIDALTAIEARNRHKGGA